MKKLHCWAFVFVLVFSIVFVSSLDSNYINQQANSIDRQIQNVTSQVDNAQKTLTNQEMRDAYLKTQLSLIVENKTGFKQIISVYRTVSPYTNPTFQYMVGMAPELSLFFVLVLVIWFFLVKYFFTIYEVLRDFSTFSQGVSIAISLCLFAVLIVLQFFQGISLFLANKIVALTELYLTSTAMKVLVFAIFVVAIIFLSKFSKEVNVLARYIRMQNYKRKKEGEEEDRNARQERATRKVETYAKAMVED